jgi:hypothetical protein
MEFGEEMFRLWKSEKLLKKLHNNFALFFFVLIILQINIAL